MKSYAIVVESLSKSYGTVRALRGVSLSIEAGSITCLVGPNGSGKTTFLDSLLGRRTPDEGEVTVLGLEPQSQREKLRRYIGMVFQSVSVPSLATSRELLALFGAARGQQLPIETVEALGLTAHLDRQSQKLSGGQKQRLAIALSLVGSPELLVLDEPTSSLDPQARRVIWDLIKEHCRSGTRTILMSTQSMEEAEAIADRVIILNDGLIEADSSVRDLIEQYAPGYTVSFSLFADVARSVRSLDAFTLDDNGDRVTCEAKVASLDQAHLLLKRVSDELSEEPMNAAIRTSSLDDVFLQITGRELRD